MDDRLCGLVVRVLGYRSGGPGSIPGTTVKKSSGSGTLSLVSTTDELLDRKVAAPVQKTDNMDVGIRHSDRVAPSIRKSWQSLRRQAAVARSVQFGRELRPWSLVLVYAFGLCFSICSLLLHDAIAVCGPLFETPCSRKPFWKDTTLEQRELPSCHVILFGAD
jgi:hypothetical protein